MTRIPRNQLLLLAIFTSSFLYRLFLTFRDIFPPGTDIGPHNGIIHTITEQGGGINFITNNYHMGGGFSATFPGYHIFVAFLTSLSGMPTYIVQGIVAVFFSSLIVIVVYLFTRTVWNSTVGLVVAVLVGFSRFDIEILMWGGYPNIIALMLIPLAFHLFLKKEQFSNFTFLTTTSIVCAAIFLTHLLSAVIFLVITLVTAPFITVFVREPNKPKISPFSWFPSIFLGVLAITPFLLQAVPEFLAANQALLTGGDVKAIQQTFLETRYVAPQLILPLIGCSFLFFIFSKYYKDKFLTASSVLLVFWLVIPVLLTQSYAVGWFTDFPRFIYFFILPLTIMIGFSFFHCARFFTEKLQHSASRVMLFKIEKNRWVHFFTKYFRNYLIGAIFVVLILVIMVELPLFAMPSEGIAIQSYYQVANREKYDASQWVLQNTATGAVFAADTDLGWWFSGFALHPTICGADPQYLSNSREVALATPVKYLLDSDFVVDNGLIQVREDGGYIGRHNPEILINDQNSYFPYAFFQLNNSQTSISFLNEGDKNSFKLSDLPVNGMELQSTEQSATIRVIHGNELFNVTRETTIYQGVMFANVTETIESSNPSVDIVQLSLVLHSKGRFLQENGTTTIGLVDTERGIVGQLIFSSLQPTISVSTENSSDISITYNLNPHSKVTISFLIGGYQAQQSSNVSKQAQNSYFKELLSQNAETWQNRTTTGAELIIYDYKYTLRSTNISYLLLRDFSQLPRFERDAIFSLVYQNSDVAVFKVKQT